jgi:hypothetical protein
MDDGELVRRMGMGVDFVRLAVRRPARVADADGSRQGRLRQLQFEVAQLALGAPALEAAVLQRGDAGGVVAPVFEPLKGVDDLGRDRRPAQDSNDAAH